MNIDAAGFEEMIRRLKKKTGASYKDVVRGVTRRVLTGAPQRTYGSNVTKMREGVKKLPDKTFQSSQWR